MGLDKPLMGRRGSKRPAAPAPLWPLYTVTFLKTVAFASAVLPACAVRTHTLTLARGGDAATAALYVGLMTAMRYVTEFLAGQLSVRWSGSLGCRPLLVVSAAAVVVETALMGLVSSPRALGLVHVLGGLTFSAGALENQCVKDEVESQSAVDRALERLACAIGAGLFVGPVLGGMLGCMYGSTAPFVGGHIVGFTAVMVALLWLPEPAPAHKVKARRMSWENVEEMPCMALLHTPLNTPRLLSHCRRGSGCSEEIKCLAPICTPRFLTHCRRGSRCGEETKCLAPLNTPLDSPRPLLVNTPRLGDGVTLQEDGSALVWYCGALALNTVGMAAYGVSSVLWMQQRFSWGSGKVGDFLAIGSCVQIFAQVIMLPLLMDAVGGRAVLATRISLACNVARFLVMAGLPNGTSAAAYLILATTAMGFCSTPLLSGLCLLHTPKGRQAFWSLGLPALNTTASVIGALVGSHMLAGGLRTTYSSGAPLLFAAAANCLAGACMSQVKTGGTQATGKYAAAMEP